MSSMLVKDRFLRSRQSANVRFLHASTSFSARTRAATIHRAEENISMSYHYVSVIRRILYHLMVVNSSRFKVTYTMFLSVHSNVIVKKGRFSYRGRV